MRLQLMLGLRRRRRKRRCPLAGTGIAFIASTVPKGQAT
jgi:hypothetical protein